MLKKDEDCNRSLSVFIQNHPAIFMKSIRPLKFNRWLKSNEFCVFSLNNYLESRNLICLL